MRNFEGFSRREFLEHLRAGALLGGAGLVGRQGASAGGGWTPPPTLNNPNILIVMVDQLRQPAWLNSSQMAALSQTVIPNIAGQIQGNAYNFGQYFATATACSPSRSAMITGLYAPQTAMYITSLETSAQAPVPGPPLQPAFPTWAEALVLLNPAYGGNIWWFGKWHLSLNLNSRPLAPYGFNTRTYPGGSPPYNPSPNGAPNEGADGGLFQNKVWASDAMIANDFIGWLQGQAPTTGPPSSPWCATVSLINPHDIASAPGWMQSGPFPPPGLPVPGVYFPPPAGAPPAFYTALPAPWNYENLQQVTNKPSIQYAMQKAVNTDDGTVSDWVLFLNQYFWLQNFVDQQIGLVLNALNSSPFANNTIIIFVSDHGEYAGSHGLHNKGWAVYDEAIHVPFSVQFPGQSGSIPMNQMCSGVDFFGLICDLGTGGSGQWRLAYPDLANRQSIWSFLYNNSSETRVAPAPLGLPYIFHTFDESSPLPAPQGKCHIVCLRTKSDPTAGVIGAKLAFYWPWAQCTIYPSTTPDPEFYDYNPQTTNNASEMGNDYYSGNQVTQNTIANYALALGGWGPPSTGLIGTELNPPLVGAGTDGNPLTAAQATARQAYYSYMNAASCNNSP